MKVKFTGESDPFALLHDKIYDVVSIEKGWYRIIDETDEDYLYPPAPFEIVDSGLIGIETHFACPCCGEITLDKPGTYRVCPNCHWEDDPTQRENPSERGGLNGISLDEAKETYKLKK